MEARERERRMPTVSVEFPAEDPQFAGQLPMSQPSFKCSNGLFLSYLTFLMSCD